MEEKFTFFWKGPFSQWWGGYSNQTSPFKDENYPDEIFICAEQYMMFRKALFFGDKATAQEIMDAKTPRDQKSLGRKVRNFDERRWDKVKTDIVYKGNFLKYTQNPSLLKSLQETDGTTLVEASPFDTVWGIGLSEDNPDAKDRTKWKGLNLLGKTLTKLREDLKNG